MVSFFDLPDDVLSIITYHATIHNNINNTYDILDYYKQLLSIKLSCKYYFKMFKYVTLFGITFNHFKYNNPFPLRENNHFVRCLCCSSYTYEIFNIEPYHDLYCTYCFIKYYN